MKIYLAGGLTTGNIHVDKIEEVLKKIKSAGLKINILESFSAIRRQRVNVLYDYANSFMLDSGAFSFLQSGKHVDWDEYVEKYIDFINQNKIKLFFELDIDSLIGYERVKEIRRQKILRVGSVKKSRIALALRCKRAKGILQFMRVNEIFFSIDGEGKRAGQLAAFIRLTGCNLRCSYCDTKYSFDDGEEIGAKQIADAVKIFRNVTLTGGEPLIQNCHELLTLLNRHEVNIETNGSIDLAEYLKHENIFFTMDFKTYSSGMYDAMSYKNLKILRDKDVLKFVVGDENDLILAEKICKEFYLKAQIYISPVFGKIKPVQIVNFMKLHNLQDWKLQLQLHKIIWKPDERGV